MNTVPNYEIERLNKFVAEIDIMIKENGYAYAYGATMCTLKDLLNRLTREPAPWEKL